jgi:predicted Zn-dependent protease
MVNPIDELVRAWRQDPSPAATVALCDALSANPTGSLVQQVGEFAKHRHAGDVAVALSVARMYIEANRFTDAQAVLVEAGKQAPREGKVYRWLGEVLLRRGDAQRAEKALARAMHLGAGDRDLKAWLDRARAYCPVQASEGANAVALEVARVMPTKKRPTMAPPPIRLQADSEETEQDVFERVHTSEIDFPPRSTGANDDPPTRIDRGGDPGSRPAPHGRNGATAAYGSVHEAGQTGGAAAAKNKPPVPHPRDVLDALALAGMYEERLDTAASASAWAKAARGPRRKGGPTLIAAMVLFLAGSVGTYLFYRQKRAQEHLQAEALLATVETRLRAAKPSELADAENELGQAFRLESRSRRAALDWARERAMMGLVKSGADIAFEDAMSRAKEVGVPEDKFAFARVASFLFQGDTAGAAAALSRWEGSAAGDEWYQMVAGATLERAGDPRARERYATATKLDPELVAAKIALARAAAVEGDTQEAMRLAKSLRQAMPDRAEPIALVALAWGRDPRREDLPAPPEVEELAKREAELPSGLKFVPHAIAALRALDKPDAGHPGDGRSEIQDGIAVADSPGAAVWLGAIAITMGDESLARKAALLGLQFSAAYEPARALAARVALLGGRLDEALKATEDLDVSPDVAVVRAASSYERVDVDGAMRALEALPPNARKLPLLAALDLADAVLSGRLRLDPAKLLTLAADDAPWADLVAMDVALDAGDLTSAEKIATRWGKDAESQALRALRLARLARYQGRLDAADALSQTALAHATVTPRVLWERVYLLVAKGRSAEAAPLLARYPLVLGPLATWLSAYAVASGGNVDAAKARTSSIDPPPRGAPLEARVVAAAAFGAMKDRRRGFEYAKDALAAGNLHPDLVAAALSLGLRRVDHGRRPPTYE